MLTLLPLPGPLLLEEPLLDGRLLLAPLDDGALLLGPLLLGPLDDGRLLEPLDDGSDEDEDHAELLLLHDEDPEDDPLDELLPPDELEQPSQQQQPA